MTLIDRLQSYLRESARQRYDAIPVAPFTIFVHPGTDFIYFNYAIPDQPVGGDLRTALIDLRAAFVARQRQPRFEFIDEYALELAPSLRAAGFVEESRTQFMICTPDSYRDAPAVSDLTITALDAHSSPADIHDFISVQRQSFGSDAIEPISEAEIADFAHRIDTAQSFLARSGGAAASVGSLTAPIDGVAEVAGIGTLPQFRGRGIATLLAGHILRHAFAHDVTLACLSAADERAGRVYERVGFRALATTLAYSEPAT